MKTTRAQNLIASVLACLCALASTTIHAQDKPAFDGSFTLADNDAVAPGGAASDDQSQNSEADPGQEAQQSRRRTHQRAHPEQLGFWHRPGARDSEIHGQHPAGHSHFHQRGLESHHPHDRAGHLRGIASQGRRESCRPGRHDAELLLLAQGTGERLDSGCWPGRLLSHRHRKASWVPANGARVRPSWRCSSSMAFHFTVFWPTRSGPSPASRTARTSTPPSSSRSSLSPPRHSIHHLLGQHRVRHHNWQGDQWTVPVNVAVQQLIKIGRQPVAFSLVIVTTPRKPGGGPDWGLRFTVTFLFPK